MLSTAPHDHVRHTVLFHTCSPEHDRLVVCRGDVAEDCVDGCVGTDVCAVLVVLTTACRDDPANEHRLGKTKQEMPERG